MEASNVYAVHIMVSLDQDPTTQSLSKVTMNQKGQNVWHHIPANMRLYFKNYKVVDREFTLVMLKA